MNARVARNPEALFDVEDDVLAIHELVAVVCEVLSSRTPPEPAVALGISRIMFDVRQRGENVRKAWEAQFNGGAT